VYGNEQQITKQQRGPKNHTSKNDWKGRHVTTCGSAPSCAKNWDSASERSPISFMFLAKASVNNY
jgi:hypothetical protein